MVAYARKHLPLKQVARHMLGLYHGEPRARLWRRMLSDAGDLRANRAELLLEALEEMEGRSIIAA